MSLSAEQTADVRSFLYLLVRRHEPRVKIGHSANTIARWRQLIAHDCVDVEASLEYEFAGTDARPAEHILHRLIADDRITDPPRSDGYMEWFRDATLSEALKFLEQHRDRLPWVAVHAVAVPIEYSKPVRTRFRDWINTAQGLAGSGGPSIEGSRP